MQLVPSSWPPGSCVHPSPQLWCCLAWRRAVGCVGHHSQHWAPPQPNYCYPCPAPIQAAFEFRSGKRLSESWNPGPRGPRPVWRGVPPPHGAKASWASGSPVLRSCGWNSQSHCTWVDVCPGVTTFQTPWPWTSSTCGPAGAHWLLLGGSPCLRGPPSRPRAD